MKNKGFTLIELLMVIAIIGVLSSIVLSALGNSRAKTNDSKVKQQLVRLRNNLALYQDNNNGNYTGSTMLAPANPCTGAMFTDNVSGTNNFTGTASAWPSGTLLRCESTSGAYAVSANLQQSGLPAAADHWCVDSVGISKAIATQLGAGQTACP